MRRMLLLALAVTVIVGGACSSSSKKTTAAGGQTTTAANQVRSVQVDGTASSYNGSFNAYFPNNVTVRPGDAVEFHSVWRGEPHTVTMGALVDAALPAAIQADSTNAPPPAAFQKLPTLLPEGGGDANQNAAQPCFRAQGEPPSNPATPCPKTAQPAFDGKQSFYNSGFLPNGDTFMVRLSADIAPGVYHYYCNLHGPEMAGTITVLAKGSAIPTQAKVDQDGTAQKSDLVTKLSAAEQQARQGQFGLPGITNAAGWGAPDARNGEINEFLPATVEAKVGQPVTWTMLGAHTISFRAPANVTGTKEWVTKAPDGAVHLTQQAGAPAGGPPVPAPNQPSGPPPAVPVLSPPFNLGSYDGSAYRSTGFIVSFPPVLTQVSLTFTKAGTYDYTCIIHPGMDGVVHVS